MKRYVLFLDEIDLEGLPEVGGKGANLGQLTRWGFRVPPGFCVTAAAQDALMDHAGLRERVSRLSSGLRPTPIADLERNAARIREMIEQAPFPPQVEEAVRNAWDRLLSQTDEAPLVAVRSSVATRDGSRSSFPGQMDTYHNLAGIEQVLKGIRRCWASAWTARAAGTRLKLGLGPEDVIVAPLVQTMVQADVAGVLFTADPVKGDTGQILVDAALGLGEAVVSGAVTPDQFVVEKRSMRLIQSRIGNQPFQISLDTDRGFGTHRVPINETERGSGCLSPGQIEDLARTGIRIEEKYEGVPQDVEWAFSRNTLFILQSRRITGIRSTEGGEEQAGESPPGPDDDEFDTPVSDPPCTYTSANISEVLPGVLTPLTAHGLKPLDYGFWKANYDLGLYPDPFPEDETDLIFLGLFYGRPHLNLTRFREIASQIPGGSVAEFDRPFPGSEGGEGEAVPFRLTPRSLLFLARFLRNAHRMWRRVPRELERFTEIVQEEYRTFRNLDLASLPLDSLLEMIEQDQEDALQVMVLHIENSLMAVGFYEGLRTLCTRWLGDNSGATAARLVTGLTTLESARPNREIYQLYRCVNASPTLRDQVLKSPPEALLDTLRSGGQPDALRFLEQLDLFLARYGYRCVNEAEMMLPSWDQDPGFVLSMIRNLLLARSPEDPEAVERQRSEERHRAVREARNRLSPGKRRLFLWIQEQAQAFITGREKNKALLMMGIHGVKNVFFELSRRLHESGQLRERLDLYFLTRKEILQLCREPAFDPYDRIPARRKTWERNRRIRLPETFRGRPVPLTDPELVPPDDPAGAETVLTGLAVSPGRVTGKARVITDPRTDTHIEEGEILVAPVTDAGWTPLFLIASAIVVDVGGLLSHGSIVAREYGIPGVLNVFTATKRIETGQIITVDGDRGTVRIHRAKPETGTEDSPND